MCSHLLLAQGFKEAWWKGRNSISERVGGSIVWLRRCAAGLKIRRSLALHEKAFIHQGFCFDNSDFWRVRPSTDGKGDLAAPEFYAQPELSLGCIQQ